VKAIARKVRLYFELDQDDFERVKEIARRKRLSRSTLIRLWITERLDKEKQEGEEKD